MMALVENRRIRVVLAGVVGLGLYLRLKGIAFGLPNTLCRPDEALVVNIAMRFGTGDLNPHMFLYPTLYLYALFVSYLMYFAAGRLTGRFDGVDAFVAEYHLNPTPFFLIDRMAVAALGTATIILVYRVSRRLFGTTTALVAAFFVAVAFLHVRDSHFGVTDIPLTFLVMVALLAIVRMQSIKTAKSYLVAGIAIGLAASTKHSGALMVLPALAAHVMNVGDERRGWARLLFDRRLWLLGAASAMAFVATTPYAFLDWPTFLADFRLQRRLLGQWLYAFVGRGWWRHLTFTLRHGLGAPLLAVALIGLIFLWAREVRKAIVVTAFPLVYYAVFGRGFLAMARYAVVLVPFLCMTAAYASCAVSARVGRTLSPRGRMLATIALAAVAGAPSLYSSIRFDQILQARDSRLVAADWMEAHAPPGSTVFQATSPFGRLQLFPTRAMLDDEIRQAEALGGKGAGPRARLAFAARTGTVGYEDWIPYGERGFVRGSTSVAGLPDYIIVERGPYARYRGEPTDLLRRSYEAAVSTPGLSMPEDLNRFDLQDLFYVPLAGFDDVERPGPAFTVYRRRDLR